MPPKRKNTQELDKPTESPKRSKKSEESKEQAPQMSHSHGNTKNSNEHTINIEDLTEDQINDYKEAFALFDKDG